MNREEMDKYMLEKKFPLECEQLPWEYLEDYEKEIAEKCINHEALTEEELKDLKQLLQDYRPFFKKYDKKTAEKNIDDSVKIVETQSELLRLLHDPNRYRIDMYMFIRGQKILVKMKIKPFTDKQYLDGVAEQMGLFRDLSVDDKKLINKHNSNQQLTIEEKKMYDSLMDKLQEKINNNDNLVTLLNEFLADRVILIGDEESNLLFEDKVAFWKEVEMDSRISLFNEVRNRLGLDDTFQEDLFPPVR